MSIVTFEIPVPKVSEADWYYKVSELKETCDYHRKNAFELKNESHKLRNDTDITTSWATLSTNSKIIDRCTEVSRWKDLFEIYYKHIQTEIENMKNDKKISEHYIEFLNLNFSVTNHCLSIREERVSSDLCYDSAYVELKNEQYILEKLKNVLTDTSHNAWEQINILEELQINVAEDLDMKNHTICIDTDLLGMTKDSINISLKPDPLRVPKDFSTYENWLQKCHNLKKRIENILSQSKKIRETMCVPRIKTKNDLRAQNDVVNFALRRRVYDTERTQNEMEWQKLNMIADKEKFCNEIQNLENALDRKLNCKKLIETRCEERLYRLGAELCLDKPTTELRKEHFQLENTTKILTNKLDQIKNMHNVLMEQVNVIDEALKNKTQSLSIDQKCLDARKVLQGRDIDEKKKLMLQ
ncbi:Hypothetical protein CINCED_3A004158 [Cinara cedri]|uniref:Tektin n=1 Tax=Cinara cedri TaxID=506608 RepID=A0A5E4NNN9_9HEMI|nr:Hypothetical protein CINCED_3A004158 [Cinara cedri]